MEKITVIYKSKCLRYLLSDVKIYDDPRVLTFIFDLVPFEAPFCTYVTKADFSQIRKCQRVKSCGTYLVYVYIVCKCDTQS